MLGRTKAGSCIKVIVGCQHIWREDKYFPNTILRVPNTHLIDAVFMCNHLGIMCYKLYKFFEDSASSSLIAFYRISRSGAIPKSHILKLCSLGNYFRYSDLREMHLSMLKLYNFLKNELIINYIIIPQVLKHKLAFWFFEFSMQKSSL